MPEEFQKLCESIGFENFRWGADAEVSLNSIVEGVRPIYARDFNGKTSVWECLL